MEFIIKDELKKIVQIEDEKKNDLFVLAAANDGEIVKSFMHLSKEMQKNAKEMSLELLMRLVKEWGLSINTGWKKVFWICDNGRICNTYDMAKFRAETEGKEFLIILEEDCQKHYKRRIKFNEAIRNEECFKYLALNIGSLGLSKFNEFCFYFENGVTNGLKSIAFIKGNSLDSYIEGDDDIAIERLLQDICTKDLVKELVAVKHKKEINEGIDEKDWPTCICNSDNYVEGIVFDDLMLEKVNHVKIEKSIDDQYDRPALDLRYGEEVSTLNMDMLNNYLSAKIKLETAGVKIEILEK